MDTVETLLFIVTRKEYVAGAGLPPSHEDDNYIRRAVPLGKLMNAFRVFFSPEGELFAVRSGDVYRGPMPSEQGLEWFSVAKKVGKVDWGNFRFILFDPNGVLYAVTGKGDFYKGPAPTNENMPWLYRQATKIGSGMWNSLRALFFDPQGILYAVKSDGRLVKRNPPTDPKDDWFATCIPVGNENWLKFTHFMAFSPDGSFWCVKDDPGYMYKWSPQAVHSNFAQKDAQSMGWGYNAGLFFAFTCDKIISSIESLEFLPDDGKIVSQGPLVLKKQTYINTSDAPLKYMFTVSETVTSSSTFSQEHGFTVEVGAELTFKAGVPFIAETEAKISINLSTSHTWNFTKSNEIKTSFSGTTEVTLEPHTSVRVTASITKGEMDVPYRARVKTMFGYETTVEGMWKGASYFNLMVSQENYKPSALSLHGCKIQNSILLT
ncbi:Hypothetical predicted protein [Pelobates cultripes]|uniref:Tachylectin 2 domain-containing protein n=1 Tax=Pelobates cultripes TaxID=61616 RepID=A0AAD1SD57_PELCU|nr:Hypothetical predicted protein [Pelobates cultripes]CAH2299207.1 Hypothetical predicted protein [Pelobates cultripes]CAH2299208.1 Hypothetical predicted protein [Pelobates cultripes]